MLAWRENAGKIPQCTSTSSPPPSSHAPRRRLPTRQARDPAQTAAITMLRGPQCLHRPSRNYRDGNEAQFAFTATVARAKSISLPRVRQKKFDESAEVTGTRNHRRVFSLCPLRDNIRLDGERLDRQRNERVAPCPPGDEAASESRHASPGEQRRN